jgi:hypothetical protein
MPAPRQRARVAARASGLPVAASIALALAAVALLVAPPESNWVWALNGLRSVSAVARLLLVATAAGAALLAVLRPRGARVWGGFSVAVALLLSFPLRERIHALGDTQIRLRSIAVFSARLFDVTMREWSKELHANPLDVVVNVMGPVGLHRLGVPFPAAVSTITLLLALVFLAGAWRLAGRLGGPTALRVPLAAALVIAGSLEVFAGYSESTGLLLATAVWWWAEMLAPLDRRAAAVRVALAWFVVFLGHRMGLLLLLPMLVRALGPGREGDEAGARRLLAGLTVAGAIAAAGVLLVSTGGPQLVMDLKDLLGRTGRGALPRLLGPSDVVNELILVAPLALLGPWFAGGGAGRSLREPAALPLVVAALLLIPLGLLLPVGESGLGAQRDFDLNVLLGLTLTVLAARVLVTLPEPGLRRALALVLPVLTLAAGGFVAVNADEGAAVRRVLAMASRPPRMADPHLGALHVYLGQRAMDMSHPELAGPYYERAYQLGGNPRRELLASEAYAVAGDTAAARRTLASARAHGPLSPSLTRSAEAIDRMLAPPDTTRRAGGAR